jgi:hypothetical protein
VWLDWRACCTPWSSISILLYIVSCLASYFSIISSMDSFIAAMRKLKSSGVSVVFILVTGDFDFFREEGSGGEPFLLFMMSTLSPGLCSTSAKSSPLPPCSGVTDVVLTNLLSTSWISSSFFVFFVFFILLGPDVFYIASALSMSDTSTRSARIRRYVDHSLVISSRSSSVIL